MTTLTLGVCGWAIRQRLTTLRWPRLGSWFPWRPWARPSGRHHAPAVTLAVRLPAYDAVIHRASTASQPPWADAPDPRLWIPARPDPIVPVAALEGWVREALGAATVPAAPADIFGM